MIVSLDTLHHSEWSLGPCCTFLIDYAFCQVVPFFSVSCQNCFQVVFAIQVMLSQFWPVYIVNVCFSYVPSSVFSDFGEKIKSE